MEHIFLKDNQLEYVVIQEILRIFKKQSFSSGRLLLYLGFLF